MFLLKEINLAPGSYSSTLPLEIQRDFRKTADEGPWREIGQWAYGVFHRNSNPSFEQANTKENRDTACRSVAIVNLKKVGGGNSSNPIEVRKYALEDREFLIRQIDIIAPKIIICCGKNFVFNVAREIFSDALNAKLVYDRKDSIKGKLYKGNKYYWVDYVHPQMRKGTHKEKFLSLLDIVEKIP